MLSFEWGHHYHPGGQRWIFSPEGDRLEPDEDTIIPAKG
jgi:hypothetical protein